MFNTVEAVQKMQDQLISWRRDLHQIPEVGLELPKTSAYVAEKLSEMGIEYQEKSNEVIWISRLFKMS
ncbi:unnamed protein product [marine sediment metagenome]|uniref:Peptidase M20 dimerisation domain-containing protein n=1 Tax=marine sediment metagenome TaxID=412755 RepID=X1JC46_9ZZZZ